MYAFSQTVVLFCLFLKLYVKVVVRFRVWFYMSQEANNTFKKRIEKSFTKRPHTSCTQF